MLKNNDFGDSNRTLLHFSAAAEYKQISEVLITNGAIVNATDAEGETPLDLAVFKSNNETAELLRKHSGKTSAELKAKGEKNFGSFHRSLDCKINIKFTLLNTRFLSSGLYIKNPKASVTEEIELSNQI